MGKLLLLTTALSAGLGTSLHGYNGGVISHIISNEHFNSYFNTQAESGIVGAIVSVFAGGAVVGSLASAFIIDDYGRRITIQVGAVINIVGVMLQASATTLSMMLIGRMVVGFACGMMSVGVPVYLSECALPRNRGQLTSFVHWMILIGFVAAAWIGYAAHNIPNPAVNPFTWRFPLAFAAIPSIFIAFALQWLPESPRYLIRQGMSDQAYRSLMKLHFNGENRDELMQTVADMDAQWWRECKLARGRSDWVAMWTVKEWRSRAVNAMLPQVFTQLTGINVTIYYQAAMFRALGVDDQGSLLLNAAYHMCAPLGGLVLMNFIIDRYGRRPPILTASVVLPVLFIIFAATSSQNPNAESRSLSSVGIALIFLYNVVYSMSFGPVTWTYLAEVLPLRIRGKGAAVGVAAGNWLLNVVVSQLSPLAMDAMSWRYYIVYVVLMLGVTLPTMYFKMKETKGVPLEEIGKLWASRAGEGEGVEGGEVKLRTRGAEMGRGPEGF